MPVAEREADNVGKGSAAELLSAWRGAERDRVAAEETASVAAMARKAAAEAAAAAKETSEAAQLALTAAQRADLAARRTAEAAELASRTATRESESADTAVGEAKTTEDAARAAFND